MEAYRNTYKVKNHKIDITLPDYFENKEVDVIILPKEEDWYDSISSKDKKRIEKSKEAHRKNITFSNDEAKQKIREYLNEKENEA